MTTQGKFIPPSTATYTLVQLFLTPLLRLGATWGSNFAGVAGSASGGASKEAREEHAELFHPCVEFADFGSHSGAGDSCRAGVLATWLCVGLCRCGVF